MVRVQSSVPYKVTQFVQINSMAYGTQVQCRIQKGSSNPHPKPTLIISFILDKSMFERILYESDKSEIHLYLLQAILSPFLWIGTIMDQFVHTME